jgi:hypothetical protein
MLPSLRTARLLEDCKAVLGRAYPYTHNFRSYYLHVTDEINFPVPQCYDYKKKESLTPAPVRRLESLIRDGLRRG